MKNHKKNKKSNLEANFYYALSHEIRRRIIKIIGDNGYTSFTQLKKDLGVSTGTIYHHLNNLSQLVEKRKNKKYYLTELGEHAYNSLKENIESIEAPTLENKEFNSPLLKILMGLTPKSYFGYNDDVQIYVLILSLIVIFIGAILSGLNGYISIFLFFTSATEDLYSLPIEIHIILSIGFIINVFIFYFIVDAFSRIFYRKSEKSKKFLISFGIIYFPMVFYLFFHFLIISFNFIDVFPLFIIDKIIMILCQVWSLWLLTYNLSVSKNLKMENCLIITLLLHYGSFTAVLFLAI
ncbi:MAG: helix-turn-helix domain-containing protein [Promethearchaeota archaeon]